MKKLETLTSIVTRIKMKTIVTTTINAPTEALKKFANKSSWNMVIVGDKKTPHDQYDIFCAEHPHCTYLSPFDHIPTRFVGWNNIQRRNIGFIYAWENGADVIATIDDDNIPYDNWGEDLLIGKTIECDLYEPENNVFDPLSITKNNHLWHRGYPIELVPQRKRVSYKGKTFRKVLIQADLWDGDPDIDAMSRLSMKPCVKFDDITAPYCSNKISPFNSQNTFLAREVIPFYSVLPHVGRMDDIWGSYILQKFFPNSLVYNKATVYQDRNVQDLITNLEKEILGYRKTLDICQDWENNLPKEANLFFREYMRYFKAF